MGKRGPRLRPAPEIPVEEAAERPPIAWNRLILTEAQGAEMLQMSRSAFRERAVAGEWPRYGGPGAYRYFAYDLLDWMLAQRRAPA